MKRVLFGALWLAVFVIAGGIIFQLLPGLAFHRRLAFDIQTARLGGEAGLDASIFLLGFACLPGVRRPKGADLAFGPWQAVAGILGFGLMMIAGGIATYNLLFAEDLILTAAHAMSRVDFAKPAVLVVSAVTGELAAALWISWYLRGLGAARLADGSPTGIGWRPAAPNGYRSAVFLAIIIILLVMVLFHFIPPDLRTLESLPAAKLFEGPGWTLVPVLILAVLLAPVLEEFVFRGIAFAGLAVRLGPLWAGVITTLLFMAAHAPEKIHYPAGFIDVALMGGCAAWLRVRYGSIRPGIVLHIVYNAGLMLAAGVVR